MNIIERFRNSFIADGVEINQPASVNEVREFEVKYGVKLPTVLMDYFLLFNGTGQGNFGDNGFAFFSLAEVKPAIEEMSHNEPDRDAYPDCFVFSDYLLWCWGYAVKLSSNGSDGPVFQVTGTAPPPRKIANSFTEFVEMYLKNRDTLL